MTKYIESPLTCAPVWAELISDRAVKCKSCHCVYTQKYEFVECYDYGRKSRIKIVGGIPDGPCTVCKRQDEEAARKALPINPELVAAVKAHAMDNYSAGWDEIVECFDDKDIWEYAAGATTAEEAIKQVASLVGLRNERYADIRSTIW